MKSHITTIRAVTAEFAGQFIRPFMWIALGIILTLVAIVGLLVFLLSEWWLLLLVPIIIISLAMLITWLVVQFILKTLSPRLDTQQKNATKEFVSKLEFAIETMQTPYPVIMFYIIRDIIFKRDAGFISEVAQKSKSLRPDYEELTRLF